MYVVEPLDGSSGNKTIHRQDLLNSRSLLPDISQVGDVDDVAQTTGQEAPYCGDDSPDTEEVSTDTYQIFIPTNSGEVRPETSPDKCHEDIHQAKLGPLDERPASHTAGEQQDLGIDDRTEYQMGSHLTPEGPVSSTAGEPAELTDTRPAEPLRRTSRTTAGLHSNPHHLPRSVDPNVLSNMAQTHLLLMQMLSGVKSVN